MARGGFRRKLLSTAKARPKTTTQAQRREELPPAVVSVGVQNFGSMNLLLLMFKHGKLLQAIKQAESAKLSTRIPAGKVWGWPSQLAKTLTQTPSPKPKPKPKPLAPPSKQANERRLSRVWHSKCY